MTAAVYSHNLTKKFGSPGRSRREWFSHSLAKSDRNHGLQLDLEGILALNRVTFQIEEGEIFGLLGGHAAGKSTLVRMMAGLIRPDGGELRIFGIDAVRQPLKVQRWTNRLGMEASFYKSLSALENLLQGARLSGINSSHTFDQAWELLHALGIEPDAMHLPLGETSPDFVQKVIVARALLSRPRLLLLDEPTRGLDTASAHAVQELVRNMRQEHNTTVVWATQDFGSAQAMCDRVAYLNGGRIAAIEASEALVLNVPGETAVFLEPYLKQN